MVVALVGWGWEAFVYLMWVNQHKYCFPTCTARSTIHVQHSFTESCRAVGNLSSPADLSHNVHLPCINQSFLS